MASLCIINQQPFESFIFFAPFATIISFVMSCSRFFSSAWTMSYHHHRIDKERNAIIILAFECGYFSRMRVRKYAGVERQLEIIDLYRDKWKTN